MKNTKNHFLKKIIHLPWLSTHIEIDPNTSTKATMSSIYTAIPLIENGLEEPLLPTTEGDIDHQEDDVHNNSSNNTTTVGWWGQRLLTSWQFFNGFWLGFVIQTVSLGSAALIAIYYGSSEMEFPLSWMTRTYEFFFFVLVVLSQSWWLLFPVICIAIDSGLTGSQGQGTFEKYLVGPRPSDSDSLSQKSQRDVFLGGVRFHVGIVFGCFIVWSLVDLYFGAPFSVYAALTASFLSCLGLCFGMVVIYDRFIGDDEQQQTQQDCLEEI